ncbi:MAG TPA: thiamine-binding protein [Patescibacteria group bacterium]
MHNSSISFQVLPKAKTDKQMIKIIDQVIKMIKKSGVNYEVGPMETTMEGDLETLFQIVKKAQYLCIKEGAKNVFTNVKIIYNPKGVLTIKQKVKKHRLI